MKTTNNIHSRKNRRLILSNALLLILAICSLLQTAFAQQHSANPEKGVGNNGSYQASNIDAVNLQNGNVTLKIPLASLPPIAGGKLSYTLTAYYNSKLWTGYRSEAAGEPDANNPCPASSTSEEIVYNGGSGGSGWSIGGAYSIRFNSAREDYDYIVPQQSCDFDESFKMAGQFFKPVLKTPDGAEHEMRLLDSYSKYDGARDHLKGYYKYTGTDTYDSMSSPTRMYSTDGSFLFAVFNPPTDPVMWRIYTNDGTQIIQHRDGVQQTRDANGNSIKIFSADGWTHVQDEQTNREIKYRTTGSIGQQVTEAQYQTVGGGWQTVTVNWGTTSVQGKLYQVSASCPAPNNLNSFLYKELGGSEGQIPVIREIILPATEANTNPRKFSFAYNSDTSSQVTSQNVRMDCGYITPTHTRTASNGLGELSEVTMPSGAKINYGYAQDGTHTFGQLGGKGIEEIAGNVLSTKSITHDGITETWAYNISMTNSVTTASVTNPDGSTSSETWYAKNPLLPPQMGGANGKAGLTYRSVQSNKVMSEKHWTLMPFTGAEEDAIGASGHKLNFNPVVDAEYTTLLDDNGNKQKMSARTFQYDYNGNLLQTTEYDWFDPNSVSRDAQGVPTGVPSGATALRTGTTSYYNEASAANSPNVYAKRDLSANPLILSAPQESITGDAKTRMSYDGQSYGTAPVKGNATQVSSWDNSNNSWISTGSTYDTYGNVTSTTDAKGNVTQILYEDSTHVMPTKTIIDPQNGTGQQISTATYDFSTGAALSKTDINGNVSNFDYTNHLLGAIDPFGRPGTVLSPETNINGTNKRQTVKTFYEDNAGRVRTEADLFDQNDGLLKSRTTADQLGRSVLSEKNENGANTYSISSQTVYKDMGRIVLQSNPTRNSGESTDGWTRVTTDNLGRSIETATFSGSAQPPWTGTNSNATGTVVASYDANSTIVTDQAGKQRRSITNGVGQLARVDEPDDAGNLGTISSPNQATIYSYDTLGNLTTVNQGVQQRSFTYNSLSRLMTANNPESGTISYSYDANGNLTSKTDARNVVTSYTYDAFNRILARSYSDGTPTVNYTYENTGIAYSKGKLTKVSSSVSENNYNSFDNLGRVLTSQQITDGNTYNFGYSYNLSGMLVEETYPSGRKVKNSFQADGALGKVETKESAGSYATRAENLTYNPAGSVSSMKLGNNKWENAQYNSRLQPVQLGLGISATDQSLWKVNYDYDTNTSNNNGNVLKQTITVPSINPMVQTYTYDNLNRLKSAQETSDNQQTWNWRQTFVYDRYGNRTFDVNNTTTIPIGCSAAQCNPTVEVSNNRFSSGQGYTYDNIGNVTADAQGRTFVYDAENKQKEVKNSSNITIGQYVYDGEGKRAKKVSAEEITLFIYDASGTLVAEYQLTSATPATPMTSYLTNDTLGSPRIVTDNTGNITSRRDFMPFGEELNGSGGRTSTLAYQSDNVRQKFTSYERDIESSLDFAQARYHNYNLGRFQSPDRYSIRVLGNKGLSLRLFSVQPQNWNSYSYCRNNPMKYIDPDGEHPAAAILAWLGRVAAGAAIGGGIGAGFETGKQTLWEGKSWNELDITKIKAKATSGAIFGATAGGTGGLSLGYQALSLGIGNIVAGGTERSINNQEVLNPVQMGVDFTSGAAGAYVARYGLNKYLDVTNPSRNARAEVVEMLMAKSAAQLSLPASAGSTVQSAIRSEIIHGFLQNRVEGLSRAGAKSFTREILLFDIARPVQSETKKNVKNTSSDFSGDCGGFEGTLNNGRKVITTCKITN